MNIRYLAVALIATTSTVVSQAAVYTVMKSDAQPGARHCTIDPTNGWAITITGSGSCEASRGANTNTINGPVTNPYDVVTGDINDDGHRDFVVADGSDTQICFNYRGTYSWFATGVPAEKLAIADVNNDGCDDILCGAGNANGGNGQVTLINGATLGNVFSNSGSGLEMDGMSVAIGGGYCWSGAPHAGSLSNGALYCHDPSSGTRQLAWANPQSFAVAGNWGVVHHDGIIVISSGFGVQSLDVNGMTATPRHYRGLNYAGPMSIQLGLDEENDVALDCIWTDGGEIIAYDHHDGSLVAQDYTPPWPWDFFVGDFDCDGKSNLAWLLDAGGPSSKIEVQNIGSEVVVSEIEFGSGGGTQTVTLNFPHMPSQVGFAGLSFAPQVKDSGPIVFTVPIHFSFMWPHPGGPVFFTDAQGSATLTVNIPAIGYSITGYSQALIFDANSFEADDSSVWTLGIN